MKKLDPRLRYLLRQYSSKTFDLSETVSVSSETKFSQIKNVLIRCTERNPERELRKAGMIIRTVIPGFFTIVSGEISLENLEKLKQLDCVAEVEASRPLTSELDISRLETLTQPLHLTLPSIKGEGVIIGIVDGGIDYTHPSFRHEDGSSRILYLWDQGESYNGKAPNDFGYGREYTKAELDAALNSSYPFQQVPHKDKSGHGTHVAGIAAGNSNSGSEFTGIAPRVDLIIVACKTEGVTLGDSQQAVDAFDYIIKRANGRPVAINQSQGMNGGGHSGETILETALDNFSRQTNLVIVKSAGNEQKWHIHAGGQITEGQTIQLELLVKSNNYRENILELWYDGTDEISIAVQPPGSKPFPFVPPGDDNDQDIDTQAGNNIFLEYDLNASDTGDTKATIFLSKGNARMLQPGTWKLLLRGDQISKGRYDIWIERAYRGSGGVEQIRFAEASADKTHTISIPGTARRIITVGSYVTRTEVGISSLIGQISSFSSHGPTRFGVQKPEIAAPGEMIIAPRSQNSSSLHQPDRWHTQMAGTSMAAPHVTGAAALILSVCPGLTCEQVKQILIQAAQKDGFAASAPDNIWGNGKLNVETAVQLAKTVQFPQIDNVQVNGATISWKTDIPTSGAVRFHPHQRQLQLGKNLGSQVNLKLQTDHELTLIGLSAGTYYCEILAFSQDNWQTTEDKDGEFYEVEISS